MLAKGLAVLFLAASATGALWAQAAAPAAQSAAGTVTKVDAGARSITVKADAGQEYSISMQPKATFRRVAPGQTDLSKAETIHLSDIAVGDRVLARGTIDNQNVSATLIVVMSQGDITKKQDAERADWDKRGVTGLVSAITPDSVTITVKNLTGSNRSPSRRRPTPSCAAMLRTRLSFPTRRPPPSPISRWAIRFGRAETGPTTAGK